MSSSVVATHHVTSPAGATGCGPAPRNSCKHGAPLPHRITVLHFLLLRVCHTCPVLFLHPLHASSFQHPPWPAWDCLAQAEEIRRQGGTAIEAQCNVTDAGAQEAAFELHLRTWARLDVAVLNAGIVEKGAA